MGKKKLNSKFVKAYGLMEAQCREKFGVPTGGVDEYIKRLESARFAPDRDEILGKLSTLQSLSRRFENEPNALRYVKDVDKKDLQWMKKFATTLKKKHDPISRYLKSARKYARGRKNRRILLTLFFLLLAAGAAVALWYFGIITF